MPHETLVTLKEYFDVRLSALDRASDVAYRAMEKRLESMNEFRSQMKDQAGSFITKAEFRVYLDKIDGDIRVLREYKSTLEGKASQSSVVISLLLAGAGLILSIASLLVKVYGN